MKNVKKLKNESVNQYFTRLRNKSYILKSSYQNINKRDIEVVLKKIDKFTEDIREVVWCLLNNLFPSLLPNSEGLHISDGASVAHIGGYVGILMRMKNRLDREGRDYWIKPLKDIGAIQEMTYISKEKYFIPGHVIAKSPHSVYKLNSNFIELLSRTHDTDFENLLNEWISESAINKRLTIQIEATRLSELNFGNDKHKELIEFSIKIYAKHFLPKYKVVYIDTEDGDRISKTEQCILNKYGIKIELSDVCPDIILFNKEENSLWFIEAVTSDGEVDFQKMNGLKRICLKSNKTFGGATTTYLSWKHLAQRQQKVKNLAINSRVWLKDDPEKEMIIM